MLRDARLCFIGSGAMGEAMIGGLLSKRAVEPGQVIGSDPSEHRRQDMSSHFGIATTGDNCEAVAKAPTSWCSAIKPQVLPHAPARDARQGGEGCAGALHRRRRALDLNCQGAWPTRRLCARCPTRRRR